VVVSAYSMGAATQASGRPDWIFRWFHRALPPAGVISILSQPGSADSPWYFCHSV
jgi:hypothetical protein